MREENSLVKNTLVVGIGTFLSRISGFFREILISSSFGATWVTDAFLIAYTIPNLLRRLFAEGALSTSVVPVFSRYGEEKKSSQEFISASFTGFTLIVSLVCILGMVFSPLLVHLIAVGFRGEVEKISLTTDFTVIMFPFLLLISWSALLMGFLNTFRIFSWSAVAPIFFNLGAIFFIYFFKPFLGPYALAWGVILGGIGQFLFQIPPLYRAGFRLYWDWKFWKNKGFRQVIGLMLPVSFSLAVSQINTIVDRVIASTCQEGAVSALYFADRLMELPLGVFGVALSVAILPSLSQKFAGEEEEEWKNTLAQGMRWILFLMLPVAAFLVIFSTPLVKLVYERGAFDFIASSMTAQALIFYSLGLPFFSLNLLLTRAFYSRGNTKTPVKVSLIAVFSNVVLDLLLVRWMDFSGLALASSLAAFLNSFLLILCLSRVSESLEIKTLLPGKWMGKILAQTTAFIFFCHFLQGRLYSGGEGKGLLSFIGIIVLVSGFYFLLTILFQLEEGQTIVYLFRNWRNNAG